MQCIYWNMPETWICKEALKVSDEYFTQIRADILALL